jgi:DNA-binding MarR family transcriptional regulator
VEGRLVDDGDMETQDLIDSLKRVDALVHKRYWVDMRFKEKPFNLMLMGKLARAQKKDPEGGVRVSQLAADFGITSPGITQTVTQLEERGLVGRKMDPEDRRAVLVYLTASGAERLAELMSVLDGVLLGLVDHLGQERSRQFLDLLNEVADYFEKKGAEAGREGESC